LGQQSRPVSDHLPTLAGMGRLSSLYSSDQRDAVIQAVLDDDLSAREAVEKARVGHLGVAAFDMPVSTAQQIVHQAKLRGRVDGLSDRSIHAVEKLLAYVERRMAKVEQLEKEGNADDVLAKRAAAMMREVEKLIAALELRAEVAHQAPAARAPTAGTAEGPSPLMEAMLRDHGRDEPAPTPDETAEPPETPHTSDCDPALLQVVDGLGLSGYVNGDSDADSSPA
jgi:hypothetical protein